METMNRQLTTNRWDDRVSHIGTATMRPVVCSRRARLPAFRCRERGATARAGGERNHKPPVFAQGPSQIADRSGRNPCSEVNEAGSSTTAPRSSPEKVSFSPIAPASLSTICEKVFSRAASSVLSIRRPSRPAIGGAELSWPGPERVCARYVVDLAAPTNFPDARVLHQNAENRVGEIMLLSPFV
jgi:hypothetical protein